MEVNGIFHHGWAQASYTHESNEMSFVIENKKELQEVAKIVGFSETVIPEILKDINLKNRKIVIIYVATPASNYYYGVKKIELIASKIHINVVGMACPNTFGCASMGGQVIILNAPKDVPEIIVNTQRLDVFEEPEYEAWNYKENKQRVDELKAAAPYNKNYSGKIYMDVADGILSNEEIRQKIFKKIDPEFQDQALKNIIACRETWELEKKVQNTYHEVQNRLIRKSYDEIEDESDDEIETVFNFPAKDKSFPYLPVVLGGLCVVSVLGVLGGITLSRK